MGIAKSSTHEYTWAIVHCHAKFLGVHRFVGTIWWNTYGTGFLISAATSRRFLIYLYIATRTDHLLITLFKNEKHRNIVTVRCNFRIYVEPWTIPKIRLNVFVLGTSKSRGVHIPSFPIQLLIWYLTLFDAYSGVKIGWRLLRCGIFHGIFHGFPHFDVASSMFFVGKRSTTRGFHRKRWENSPMFLRLLKFNPEDPWDALLAAWKNVGAPQSKFWKRWESHQKARSVSGNDLWISMISMFMVDLWFYLC